MSSSLRRFFTLSASGGEGRGEVALLFVLAAVQFTHIMDFMIMMPLGPQLMRVMLISPQQFGLLVSAYTLTAAVAALAVAFYTDRFDRRKALLVLYAGFVISTLLCGIAPGYGTLLAARAVAGAFGGVAGATVHSIIGDAIPEQRRGAATGMIMSAFALSSIIGVPIGLFLAAHFSWRAPFLFLVVVSTLVLILTWRILPPMRSHIVEGQSHRPLDQMKAVLGTANHLRAFVFMFALMFAGFSVIPFISPYMVANVGLKETDLPYLYFFGGIATAFSSRYIGKLADRHGKRQIFTTIGLISIAPLLITTNLPPVPVWVAIVASVIFMVFVSGRFVPAMALVISSVEPRLRGGFMSINSAIQQLGLGAASLLAGTIIGHGAGGTLTRYWLVGFIAVGATLLAIALAWRVKPVA
ncbi:MAG TPA: MFS transporter [Burkholderiales bacterium]|nr:MFS transporter [Burkholderiales bacterium]